MKDEYTNQFNVNEDVIEGRNSFQNEYTYNTYAENGRRNDYCCESNDKRSFWFALLAFCSPLFGLILYLIYEDKKPQRAQSLLNGLIAGIVTRIVLIIMIFSLGLLPALNSAKQTSELYNVMLSDLYESLLSSQ